MYFRRMPPLLFLIAVFGVAAIFDRVSGLGVVKRDTLKTGTGMGEFDQAVDNLNYTDVRHLLDQIVQETRRKHGIKLDLPDVLHGEIKRFKETPVDDGTEAGVNRRYYLDMFETDILLNAHQATHILSEIKSSISPQRSPRNLPLSSSQRSRRRRRRQAVPDPTTFWPLTVNYVFGVNDSSWQKSIRMGQAHIESLTCLRYKLVEVDEKNTTEKVDYIQYIRGSGCWSLVGRQGGRQQVSIGYGCESLGIVAHENLHALGLWHEQSRLDRDSFIQIVWDAIFPSTQSNFEKRSPTTSDNMGQPYDLGSTMHYGNKAFSTDWSKYTIITNDKNYQQTIGQRAGLSFKDAKMINLRYCTKSCEGRELSCRNGGYTDPLSCGKCRCPEGYSGTLCDFLASGNSPCGGDLTSGVWAGAISSGTLVAKTTCIWRLRPIAGYKQVEIALTGMNFPCKDACGSFIEIKYQKDKVPTGARFCCDAPKTPIISDPGTEVLMILQSGPTLDKANYTGFTLQHKVYDGRVIPTEPRWYGYRAAVTWGQPQKKRRSRWKTTCGADGRRQVVQEFFPTTNEEGNATKDEEERHQQQLKQQPQAQAPITVPTTTPTTEEPPSPTTSTPSPSTTDSTTPEEGASTTEDYERGKWTEWANWGGCTATCGACGIRKRVRACYGGECKGEPFEVERCAYNACPLSEHGHQPVLAHRCVGRVVLPCDLIKQLDFGTVSANEPHNSKNSNGGKAAAIGESNDQLPRAIPSHPSSTTGEDRQQHAPQAQTSHKVVVPLPLAAADISSSSTIPPPPSSSSAAAREPEMPMMTVTGRPVQMELPVLGISGSSATDDVPVIYDAFSHHHQQQPFEGPQQPTADFLIPTANNARMLRRFRRRGRRFVSSSNGGGQQQIPEADGSVYCEKRFAYNCPTPVLSINMDYKLRPSVANGTSSAINVDERRCCRGFFFQPTGEQCAKRI